MDVADMWRTIRRDPAAARPHVGAHVATAEEGISMTVTQDCQVALPSANRVPEVTVTITSNRPGVAAAVTNVNERATITLLGQYITADFHVSSDKHGAPLSLIRLSALRRPSRWSIRSRLRLRAS
jgi:hypothetical protein